MSHQSLAASKFGISSAVVSHSVRLHSVPEPARRSRPESHGISVLPDRSPRIVVFVYRS